MLRVLSPPKAGKLKIKDQKLKIAFNVPVTFNGEATPVPISNTEVKLSSADDSRKAKVGGCRNFKCYFLLYFFSAKMFIWL